METTNKPDCIFCKIVNGEIPSHKVYEDKNFIAFLDIHPQSTGHCQVIPRQHCQWVWDVTNLAEYIEVARKVANAQRKAFGTEMIVSHIIGDEVPHAHIWLVPKKHSQNGKVSLEEAKDLILRALR